MTDTQDGFWLQLRERLDAHKSILDRLDKDLHVLWMKMDDLEKERRRPFSVVVQTLIAGLLAVNLIFLAKLDSRMDGMNVRIGVVEVQLMTAISDRRIQFQAMDARLDKLEAARAK